MDDKNLNSCQCSPKEENCGCENHEHDEVHDCDCGCEDHENLVVDLEDENGNLVSCEIIDEFEYKNKQYVLVQNPENDSVYLFKAEMGDDEQELVIPEDEEFEEVSAYYAELVEKSED